MSEACFYCLSQTSEIVTCVNSCLLNSGISPTYPTGILIGSAFLSITFLFLGAFFKNDIKKFIGFRLLSIAFLATSLFTLGLIFHGHFILKNLPIVIPLMGLLSYIGSYFFSYYIIRISHKPLPFSSNSLHIYLQKLSKKLGVNTPKLCIFFSREPKAFVVDGFKKAIFISYNLIEKMDEKSIKAILLHELYHLKRHSGILKNFVNSLANLNFRIIPVPLKELEKYDEEEVDKLLLKKHRIDIKKIKRKLHVQ